MGSLPFITFLFLVLSITPVSHKASFLAHCWCVYNVCHKMTVVLFELS